MILKNEDSTVNLQRSSDGRMNHHNLRIGHTRQEMPATSIHRNLNQTKLNLKNLFYRDGTRMFIVSIQCRLGEGGGQTGCSPSVAAPGVEHRQEEEVQSGYLRGGPLLAHRPAIGPWPT